MPVSSSLSDPDDTRAATAGIRAKLSRANEHLELLGREMDAYIDRSPHSYTIDPNGEFVDSFRVHRFKLLEPMPVTWGVILGEIVHNLHSALDHTVCQLLLDKGISIGPGNTVKRPGFPICEKPSEWKDGAKSIRGVGPGVEAFIKSLQPYESPQVAGHPLWSLKTLWNQDKHRLIQSWGFQIKTTDHLVFDPPPIELIANFGVLEDGAEAFRVRFDKSVANVKMEGYVPLHIAFQDPGDPNNTQSETLFSLYDYTVGIVSVLLSMIGNQAALPIPWQAPV